jgi:hypothetical protein
MLLLGGMTWVDDDWSKAWSAVMETIRKGDLLLVIAAIVADAIGRLFQSIVTQNPRKNVGIKVGVVVVLGVVAVACALEYVKVSSDLPPLLVQGATHAQTAMASRIYAHVIASSKIFSWIAFVFGFAVILMVED